MARHAKTYVGPKLIPIPFLTLTLGAFPRSGGTIPRDLIVTVFPKEMYSRDWQRSRGIRSLGTSLVFRSLGGHVLSSIVLAPWSTFGLGVSEIGGGKRRNTTV